MVWWKRRKKDPFAKYPFTFHKGDRVHPRGGTKFGTVLTSYMDERRGEMVGLQWDGSGYIEHEPPYALVRFHFRQGDRVRKLSGGPSGTVLGVWAGERDIEWVQVHWDGEGPPNLGDVAAASLERAEVTE